MNLLNNLKAELNEKNAETVYNALLGMEPKAITCPKAVNATLSPIPGVGPKTIDKVNGVLNDCNSKQLIKMLRKKQKDQADKLNEQNQLMSKLKPEPKPEANTKPEPKPEPKPEAKTKTKPKLNTGDKTLVVSDLHGNLRAWDLTKAFVDQEQVTRLVINGDLCDNKRVSTTVDHSVKLYREILKYAEAKNGVELVLIWGNHDAGTLLWDSKGENAPFQLAKFWGLQLDSEKFKKVQGEARAIRNGLRANAVKKLLKLFKTSYKLGDTLVCHAGLVAQEPSEVKDLASLKAWTNPTDPEVVNWAKTYDGSQGHVVFGHVSRKKKCWGDVEPDGEHYTCIDNGAKSGANPGFALLDANGSITDSGVINLAMSEEHARRLVATTSLFGEDAVSSLVEGFKNTVSWWLDNHETFLKIKTQENNTPQALLKALCTYDSEQWKEAFKESRHYAYLEKKLTNFDFAEWYIINKETSATRSNSEVGDMWGALLNARTTLLGAVTDEKAKSVQNLGADAMICLAEAFSANVAGGAAQRMVDSLDSYNYTTSINFGYVDANQRGLIKIGADAQGQEVVGASVLDLHLSGLSNDIINIKYLGGLDRDDSFGTILADLSKELGGLNYGRVGTSATLLVNKGEDGKLSAGANLQDRLFPEASNVSAYLSSLFNSTVREPLGATRPQDIHNNGKTKVVVYDPELLKFKFLNFAESLGLKNMEKMVAAMSGADGSGIQSLDPEIVGQIRGIIARYLSDRQSQLPAAFFKGLQSYKRIALTEDGKLFTVLDLAKQLLECDEIDAADTPIKALELACKTWEETLQEGVKQGKYFRFLGIDAGEIKGRGKDEFSLVLGDTDDVQKLEQVLTKEKPFLVLDDHTHENDLRVLCWQIIPSPWDAKQAFNFQPTAMMRKLDGTPFEDGNAIEQKLIRTYEGLNDKASDRKFDEMMDRLGLSLPLRKLALGNPNNAIWRAVTNGTWRDQPTKRLIMSSFKLDGLIVGDNSWFRENSLVRVLNYRGPLLVPQALQANAIITERKLFQWFKLDRDTLEAREDFTQAYERCKSIHDYRFNGKKGHVADYSIDFFFGELNKLLNLCALQPLDARLCIMFCADVAAMQGDDDGDLTVWCTERYIVEAAIDNEKFWMKAFADIPGLRAPAIELDKKAKLKFANAWKSEEDLKTMGLNVDKELADAIMGKGQKLNMIPPPQAFTQRQLLEHWDALTASVSFPAFCARIGGNPQGPVGIGSNGAVEVLMSVHFVLNNKTGKLEFKDKRSAMLWRAYLFMAFAVQTSIDWAKRAYLLLAFWLFDLLDTDGTPVINFNEEISLETIKKWNVNEHPELNRVKLVPLDGGGSKIVVGVKDIKAWRKKYTSDVLDFEEYTDTFFNDGSNIPMIDESNGCFDVKTVVEILKGLFGKKGYKPFAWKLDKTVNQLVGNQDFRNAFSDLMKESADTHFKHSALAVCSILEKDGPISKQLKAMSPEALKPAFQKGLCENKLTMIDAKFSEMEQEVTRFFGSKRWGEDKVKNSELARVILVALGFPVDAVLALLSSGNIDSAIKLGDHSFTLVEIVKCLGAIQQVPTSDTVIATYWQIMVSAFVEKQEVNNPYTATLISRVAVPFRGLMGELANSDKTRREKAFAIFKDPDSAVGIIESVCNLRPDEISQEQKQLLFGEISAVLEPFKDIKGTPSIQVLARFYIAALKILILVENSRSSYTSLWVEAINWEISEYNSSPTKAAARVSAAFSNEFAMFVSSLRLATQKGFAEDMIGLYNPQGKSSSDKFQSRPASSLNLRNVIWGGDFTFQRFLEGVREFKRPSVGFVYPMQPYYKMLGFAQAVAKNTGALIMSHYLFRNIGVKTAYDIAFIRAVSGDFALNGQRYFLTPSNPGYRKWTPGSFVMKTFPDGRVGTNQVQYMYKMTSHLTKAGCYDSDAQFGKSERKQVAFAFKDVVDNGGEGLAMRLFEPRMFKRNPLAIAGSATELLDGKAWLERFDEANKKGEEKGKKPKLLSEAERNEIHTLATPDVDPRWFLRQLNGTSNLKNNTWGFRTLQGMLAEGFAAKHILRTIVQKINARWKLGLSADGFAFKILYDADWSYTFSSKFTVGQDKSGLRMNLASIQKDALQGAPKYKIAGTYASKKTGSRVMFDANFGLSNYQLNKGKDLEPKFIRKTLSSLISKAQLFDYIMEGYSLAVDYPLVATGQEFVVDNRVIKTEVVIDDSDIVFYDEDYEVLDNSAEPEPQRQPEPKREAPRQLPMVDILPEDQTPPPGFEPDFSRGIEDVNMPDFGTGLEEPPKPSVHVIFANVRPDQDKAGYIAEMHRLWHIMLAEGLANDKTEIVDLFIHKNLHLVYDGNKKPSYRRVDVTDGPQQLAKALVRIFEENKVPVLFVDKNNPQLEKLLMNFLNVGYSPKVIG
jgi:predicted phosphodiesterase/glutaredoxin